MTRAKERLYLLRAFRRGFRGGSEPTMPSRFLMDIPKSLISAPPKAELKQKKMSAAWSSSGNGAGEKPSAMEPTRRRIKRGEPQEEEPAVVHFVAGDKVKHATFGEGIVVDCKPVRGDFEVTVAFTDGAGVKRLMLGFAPLERSG